MLIQPVPKVELVEVDSLDETARGHRGFGHTGA
jgi:dUTPase